MKNTTIIITALLLCMSCGNSEDVTEVTSEAQLEIQKELEQNNAEIEKIDKASEALKNASEELDNLLTDLN